MDTTAKDWRIGNYYLFNGQGEPQQCKWVHVEDSMRFMHPIQLTEEWLVKFGFTGRKDFMWNGIIGIQIKDGKFYLALKDLSNVIFHSIVEIEFVHELQNTFKDLTKQELTIK